MAIEKYIASGCRLLLVKKYAIWLILYSSIHKYSDNPLGWAWAMLIGLIGEMGGSWNLIWG